MPFIILCGVIAFIVQMVVLYSNISRQCRLLRLVPLIAMELFPACTATHAVITKQPSGILGWTFSVAVSGWIAGAILIGYVLAWSIYLFKHN